MYELEHHLSQQEAMQLVKDYTSEHAQLEMEYYLGLTLKSKQSFQEMIDDLSLAFHSCKMVSSMIGISIIGSKNQEIPRTQLQTSCRYW